MNKTISINISGFVFNIEEQAYETLNTYLNRIRSNFKNEEERDEIMADIESRIAELFQEKITSSKQVIIPNDISEVIEILGHPEDFQSEEDFEQESDFQNNTDNNNDEKQKETTKRLFRDPDNASIGGVCSGLGHYLNLDVVIVRIIFVILFVVGGSGFLIYLILLFVIPEAKTTTDKIQMQGGSVNVESIRDHIVNIKKTVTDSAQKGNKKFHQNIRETVDKSITATQSSFSVISGIIGIFTLALIYFSDISILPFFSINRTINIPTLIDIFNPGAGGTFLIYLSLLVVTFIPLIWLVITGLKITLNLRHKLKPFIWGFAIIWILGLVTLMFNGVRLGTHLQAKSEIEYNVALENDSTDYIFIDVMNDDQFSNWDVDYGWNRTELIHVTEDQIYCGYPKLKIIQTRETARFQITLLKKSFGYSKKDAAQKAENFNYEIDVKGNHVNLAPYFSIDRPEKFRMQRPIIEIRVPIGKKIKFGGNVDRILTNLPGDHNRYETVYANTTWESMLDGFSINSIESTRNEYEKR